MSAPKIDHTRWTICWSGKRGQLVFEQRAEKWEAESRATELSTVQNGRPPLLTPEAISTLRVVDPGGMRAIRTRPGSPQQPELFA